MKDITFAATSLSFTSNYTLVLMQTKMFGMAAIEKYKQSFCCTTFKKCEANTTVMQPVSKSFFFACSMFYF